MQIKREDDTADSSVVQLLYKEVDTEEEKVYWDRNDPNAEEAFDEIINNAVHMFDSMAHPIDKESFAFVSMWAQDAPVDLDCMLEYVPNDSTWLMPSSIPFLTPHFSHSCSRTEGLLQEVECSPIAHTISSESRCCQKYVPIKIPCYDFTLKHKDECIADFRYRTLAARRMCC